MLNVCKTRDTVRVVNDQIGTPIYTYDLTRLLVDMNEIERYSYYYVTNGAVISAGTISPRKSTVRLATRRKFYL